MRPEIYSLYSRFLTWVGDLYMATEPPLCKAKQIEDMLEVIQPGDILCRGYHFYLDSYIIPGEFTHSGVILNKKEMVHSIAEGVQYIHPIDFIKDTDQFIILRPPYESDLWYFAVNKAVWHVQNKTQYDFTFKDETKFYCHEFSVDCLNAARIKVNTTHKTFGVWPIKFERDLYLAQNLIDVCRTVYEFNP